jgi:L,D-transpeptidase YcbB
MVNSLLSTSFLNSFTIGALLQLTESTRVFAVKRQILGAAACAALITIAAPALAANTPTISAFIPAADPGTASFYAQRRGALLWLAKGPDGAAVRELFRVLHRSSLDGFAGGPLIAAQAEGLIARAGDDPAALAAADQLLSSAWVRYVAILRRSPEGMVYADPRIAPRPATPDQTLMLAAAAPSLAEHVRAVSEPNPFYTALRDAAWTQSQASGLAPDPRLLASLDRARVFPTQGRYLVVDAASARLFMVENGTIADSMKVIVGKPSSQTPMLASVIYYATLKPYWNVPPDLVRTLIAPRVLDQGVGYLKAHGYEVLTGFSEDAELIAPSDVDWKAVAAGRDNVRVRQQPGPGNSMGQIKFGFANDAGVFLHDTPNKDLFAGDGRSLSNGCIRLEDAQRLGRWLTGGEMSVTSAEPEQHLALPRPTPVFVTYLTAHVDNGQVSFFDDAYGRDSSPVLAGLARN